MHREKNIGISTKRHNSPQECLCILVPVKNLIGYTIITFSIIIWVYWSKYKIYRGGWGRTAYRGTMRGRGTLGLRRTKEGKIERLKTIELRQNGTGVKWVSGQWCDM